MRRWSISGGLVTATGLLLSGCALDDRSPSSVAARNEPQSEGSGGASAGAPLPPSGGAGSSAASTGGEGDPAGGAGSSAGPARGERPGAGGRGSGAAVPESGAAGAGDVVMSTEPIDLSGLAPASVENGTCPAFAACGGDVLGSWAYTDACPTESEGVQLPGCTVETEYEAGGAAALSFSEGQVTRGGAPVGDGVVTFPGVCLGPLSCADLTSFIGGRGTCSAVVSGCACRTAFSVDWGQQAYTLSGTQLALADGRTFDYCVDGDRLTYREAGDATEPGVFTLQRF
jgi:hypothetical protein